MHRLVDAAIRAARAGRGRWVALCLLAMMCLPLALPDYSPFKRLRLTWFDFYQFVLPRERPSGQVTIVAIDERSLRELGQWPWPRTRLAALIERIGEQGARAIGVDIVMPEPDQTSPDALVSRLDPGYEQLAGALSSMPSYDALLGDAMRRYPVVLGAAGMNSAAPSTTEALITRPVILHGGELTRPLHNYSHSLVSLLRFQLAASGQGIISTELERGVLRRVPLISSVDGTLVPGLAVELIRVAIGMPAANVYVNDGTATALSVGELHVPIEPTGEIWVHFGGLRPDRYLSAARVLEGDVDPAWLKDKIVLIGLTGLEELDHKITAIGESVPGVEVHAQVVESLFDRRFLRRPPWMPQAEVAAIALLGGLLIWAVPAMRRNASAFLLLLMLLLVIGLGFALFAWSGLLVDAATLVITLLVLFSSLIASALAYSDHARRVSQRSLRAARETAARVDGELEAARRIQLGILPRSDSSFPHEKRFKLAAAIEPARAVGGDLYDFFMLDADRLFFHIADVSGKGIPASLFMSITKVLTKSVALRAGRNPEQLLTQANIEISRDNPESLFVTAFAAIIDVATGELRYWTAGHDTPFVYDGAQALQLDRSQSGPPLCVLEHYQYPGQQFRLTPGALLVLFTDGVSEAENPAGQLYGKERLAACLTRLPRDASAEAALDAIRADVDAFVAGAPASDDLTLLVLRWLGPMALSPDISPGWPEAKAGVAA